jgi:hypothetical protein
MIISDLGHYLGLTSPLLQYIVFGLLVFILIVLLYIIYINCCQFYRKKKIKTNDINPKVKKKKTPSLRYFLYGLNKEEIKFSPPLFPLFYFYRLDRKLHPELYVKKEKMPSKKPPMVEYKPRNLNDDDIVKHEECKFPRGELVTHITTEIEKNNNLRPQMYLSVKTIGNLFLMKYLMFL